MKPSKTSLSVLLIFTIVISSACSSLNSYQAEGTLALHGLKEPVKVLRDEKGMAYIYAHNMEDESELLVRWMVGGDEDVIYITSHIVYPMHQYSGQRC